MDEGVARRVSGELVNYANETQCPVAAIHGKNGPHSAGGIKIPLESRLSDFKIYGLDKCEHEVGKEYYAKDEFLLF